MEVPTRSTGVSAGDSHSVAYNTQLNLVFMWGSYRNSLTGQMHEPHTVPKRIGMLEFGRRALKKVVSGAHHTLVLADDRLFAWGDPESGKIGRDIRTRRRNESSLNIEGLMEKGVVDVFAGAYTSFLRNEGDVVKAWGLNNYGQLGIGSLSNTHMPTRVEELCGKGVTQIVGGEHHSLALTAAG